ncbi:GxxExxY protein [Coraliomargarita sp. W4R53]
MPIQTEITLSKPTEKRFREMDYQVMAEAFSIQNELGNIHDESIYQEALYQRTEQCGLSPNKELQIKLTHENFSKDYYLDLCISGEIIYELKTVERISKTHEAQLLNYLFLADLPFGKIINFRPKSVESRYVSTSLHKTARQQFEFYQNEWIQLSDYCLQIPELLQSLLADWGTHLDLHAYKEALIHLLDLSIEPIKIYDSEICIGKRPELIINDTTILHFTSLRGNLLPYKKQLKRLLDHTSLKHIQWINFAGKKINLISLNK